MQEEVNEYITKIKNDMNDIKERIRQVEEQLEDGTFTPQVNNEN